MGCRAFTSRVDSCIRTHVALSTGASRDAGSPLPSGGRRHPRLTLLSVAVGAFEPLALEWIVDELSGPRRGAALVRLVLLLVGLGLAHEVLGAIANHQTWRTRLKLDFNLLEAAVGRLHQLPISFHQQAGVGATMTRLDRGIQGLVAAFSEVAFTVVPALAYLVIGRRGRAPWRTPAAGCGCPRPRRG